MVECLQDQILFDFGNRASDKGARGGVGITLLGLTMAFPPAPRLVWNASASAPIGLYAVTPGAPVGPGDMVIARSEEHTSELQSLMRISYAVFCLKKKNK